MKAKQNLKKLGTRTKASPVKTLTDHRSSSSEVIDDYSSSEVTTDHLTSKKISISISQKISISHPATENECPNAFVDLVFVLDGSGSIGGKRFEYMKASVFKTGKAVYLDFNGIPQDLARLPV